MLARSATAFAPASIIAASLTSVVSTNPASGANVDSPVTDAVTQANVKVLSNSPAMARSQDSQAKVFRKVDAMAQRLAECGEACVLNVHVHTAPGPVRDAKGDSCEAGDFQVSGADIPSSGTVTPAQLITTCLVARMEATSGVDVEGVAWVIQDAPTEISSPIFEVDLYVQRLP